MNESALLASVCRLCAQFGLKYIHFTDSRWQIGTRGFPDLVIAGPRGVLFRELKTENGILHIPQRQWGSILRSGGSNWAVWRPVDLRSGTIRRQLQQLTLSPPE